MSQVIAGIICLGIFGGPAAFVVIKGGDQSERAAAASEKGWEYIGVGTVIAVLGILLRWLLFSEWLQKSLTDMRIRGSRRSHSSLSNLWRC